MTRHITPPDPPHAPPPGGPRAADGSVPPEADAQVEPSPPDLVVEGGHLFVTLDLHIPRDVLAHYVGTNLLVLWRSDDPDREARVIRFPVDVDPARAVIRVVNGVLDLEVPVAESRSRAVPVPVPVHTFLLPLAVPISPWMVPNDGANTQDNDDSIGG